ARPMLCASKGAWNRPPAPIRETSPPVTHSPCPPVLRISAACSLKCAAIRVFSRLRLHPRIRHCPCPHSPLSLTPNGKLFACRRLGLPPPTPPFTRTPWFWNFASTARPETSPSTSMRFDSTSAGFHRRGAETQRKAFSFRPPRICASAAKASVAHLRPPPFKLSRNKQSRAETPRRRGSK